MTWMDLVRYYWRQFRDNPFTTFADKPGEPDRDHNTQTGRDSKED
ncbi:hypothetical protein SEA_SIXAMA_31 [Gordonia phage Sixama]|uniref:Uncharacterized protein n=1 Tax=Gordonia phage Sixama TaxID=2653271 RepID=A0A5Q2F0C7_9CAUD|nr:hypothetical protein PP302_gp031 [Gordonia phage Sixama]QGF20210.1 hypothetical protein SEA_SIXAMA_31 [Gordonia phage Sixama]